MTVSTSCQNTVMPLEKNGMHPPFQSEDPVCQMVLHTPTAAGNRHGIPFTSKAFAPAYILTSLVSITSRTMTLSFFISRSQPAGRGRQENCWHLPMVSNPKTSRNEIGALPPLPILRNFNDKFSFKSRAGPGFQPLKDPKHRHSGPMYQRRDHQIHQFSNG